MVSNRLFADVRRRSPGLSSKLSSTAAEAPIPQCLTQLGEWAAIRCDALQRVARWAVFDIAHVQPGEQADNEPPLASAVSPLSCAEAPVASPVVTVLMWLRSPSPAPRR